MRMNLESIWVIYEPWFTFHAPDSGFCLLFGAVYTNEKFVFGPSTSRMYQSRKTESILRFLVLIAGLVLSQN